MKTLLYLVISLLIPCFVSSQTIKINYNNEDNSFDVQKCKDDGSNCKEFNGDIDIGETYKITISGINTAVTKTALEIKPFDLESSIPTIIQPIFPGITNSGEISFSDAAAATGPAGGPFSDLDNLADNALLIYKELLDVKKIADTLYTSTIYTTNNPLAMIYFNLLCNDFSATTGSNKDKIEKINQKIVTGQIYINSVKDIFTKRFENSSNITKDIVDKYSYVIIMSNTVNKTNFTKYSNFIYKSLSAKTETKPEKFIAQSDGIDLNIMLLNTYVSDTIAKKTIDFYTKGNLSFDFSTGFFYSNQIEQSYYLEKRDSLKSDILKEPIRNFDVSFGALGHLSYKFSSRFKAGVSMGASLSPIDGKTRYLLGSSIIFGRKNQIALNAGFKFIKLKVLSDSVNQDAEGTYVDADVTSVPTFEKVQSGFFIGITYNLTAKKKYGK